MPQRRCRTICRRCYNLVHGDIGWNATEGQCECCRRYGPCMQAVAPVVVAAGGCFDVLHRGHVSLLRQARAMGDMLIVLMNSDSSVHDLKGEGRPINDFDARRDVLMELRSVDEVLEFGDNEPSWALDILRPDIWVKGQEYNLKEHGGGGLSCPERAIIEGYGGRVAYVSRFYKVSSTQIIASGRVGHG